MKIHAMALAALLGLAGNAATAAPPAPTGLGATDDGPVSKLVLRGTKRPLNGGIAGGGGPRDCPPGSNYSQRPHQPTEPWTAVASDLDAGEWRYENFAHDGRDISSIWFWGMDVGFDAPSGTFFECDEPLPLFEVIFYPDAGGIPDKANPICGVFAEAREKNFKDLYDFQGQLFEAFQYKVNIDPVCQLPPGTYWVLIRGLAGDPNCWFFWLSSPEGLDGQHFIQFADGTQDLTALDLSLCINRAADVQPQFCPADFDDNKVVDVDDLTAVILSWGTCPAPCPPICPGDANKDCEVNVDDLTAVILGWGACPTPPNDECEGKIFIDRLDPAGVLEVPFDIRGATPSPEPSQCTGFDPNPFKDAWYCLRNLSDLPKTVTVTTTVDLLIEVTDGCVCPPGPLVGCGLGVFGGVTFDLVAGQEVCLRLLNDLELPNEDLKGLIRISNEPNVPECPNDECIDRIPIGEGSFTFDTTGCTTNPTDPPFRCGLNVSNDIWFNYTAPGNGEISIDTFGSLFDTVLKAYDGFACPPDDASNLGCNDDAAGTLQSQLVLPVAHGQEIKIRVGGWNGASGVGVLNVSFLEVIGPRNCPADANYGQRPFQSDEDLDGDGLGDWFFGTSDLGSGFKRYDDFSHDGRAIDRLFFWGADLQFIPGQGFVECDLANPFFEISFYFDDGTGFPDKANPVCSYFVPAVNKVRKDQYVTADGLLTITGWYYEVVLDPPCPLPQGKHWLSIQGAGGGPADPPDCWFLWLNSPESNTPGSVLTQPDGTQSFEPQDWSFCIMGIPLPTGACCFTDGTCQDGLTQNDCEANGGIYQGDNTSCADLNCLFPACADPAAGDCCVANGGLGCNNNDCCRRVCAIDPFCCNTTWDQVCADEAAMFPQCGCPQVPLPELEPCPPGGCPPPEVPEWCLYQVLDVSDPNECGNFKLFPGALICVSPCPFPGDAPPCLPDGEPVFQFRVVGTNCVITVGSLNSCEPCPPGFTAWNRIN